MNRFEQLWNGFIAGSLTTSELQEFLSLLEGEEEFINNGITQLLREGRTGLSLSGEQEIIWEGVIQRTRTTTKEKSIISRMPTRWWWAAAAAIVLVLAGAYLWIFMNNRNSTVPGSTQVASTDGTDIRPGGQKAVLTLADGSTIILDSAANGQLALQESSRIVKENGRVIYAAVDSLRREGRNDGVISYNTMATPRGGQYQLTLPDGTDVWLNAASSITYPTVFAEKTREVTMTGEAYFKVRKSAHKPFIVKTPQDDIIVTGTEFNINAYLDNGHVKTSLVEGSVKISTNTLQPGQAFTNGIIINTNISQDIAWKNGLFNFDGASVPEIMRQLERWYDVTVVYEGIIPERAFKGKIQRSLNLSEALELLRGAGIHWRIDNNKRLIITP